MEQDSQVFSEEGIFLTVVFLLFIAPTGGSNPAGPITSITLLRQESPSI